jgi:hypothetical protein
LVALPTLIERLREQRSNVRTAAAQILTRAADEQRDLNPDELAEHCRLLSGNVMV